MSKKQKLEKFDSVEKAARLQAQWQYTAALIEHNNALELTNRIMEHGKSRQKTSEHSEKTSEVSAIEDNKES